MARDQGQGGPPRGLRERFLSSLDGDCHGPPVFVPDLSYWLAAHPQSWQGDIESELAFHGRLGVMPYYLYGGGLYSTRFEGVTVRSETRAGVTTTVWESEHGSLCKEATQLPDSATQAVTRYPVGTARDLQCLVHMVEALQVFAKPREAYVERDALFARFDGYPIWALPRSPLPSLITDWAGVMNGIVLLMDHPDLCQAFFHAMERPCLEAVTCVCAVAPPVVHVCDNLTSDVYTPYYETLMAPYYRRVLKQLHASGVKVVTHLDGTTRGLLPLLAATGFDAIEAVTPAPVGDLTMAEMRCAVGADTVLWGGLPGAMFAPPWTWSQMRGHVEELLRAWGGGPFVVGIADQLPPDGDLEMVARIASLIEGRTTGQTGVGT